MPDCPCNFCRNKEDSRITVEVNGVANLLLMVDAMERDGYLCTEHAGKMRDQLDALERYLLEISRAAAQGRRNAYWHEVRDNRSKYPTNNGDRND